MALVTDAVAEGLQKRKQDKAEADAAASEGEVVAETKATEIIEEVAETAEVVEETTEDVAAPIPTEDKDAETTEKETPEVESEEPTEDN